MALPFGWKLHWLFAPVSAPSPTMSSSPTSRPMTQPRTVRNFVHSARSSEPNPSLPVAAGGR